MEQELLLFYESFVFVWKILRKSGNSLFGKRIFLRVDLNKFISVYIKNKWENFLVKAGSNKIEVTVRI